ncbi:uncharacterized protein LOC114306725 [Camellia sinensis]|uniref:uncharacterized protein LOC114306725 n=1 Tax=Camellia sinensis TaxID=4442 RepID=UPI001035F2C2|nr:uncharacterized protein LOC114306725 [Camellia sinensis]
MAVAEYEAKFTELARFAPQMVDTNYKKARKFEGGLDLEVFDWVGVLKLPTYVEVLDRALMAEATIAAKKQTVNPPTEWKGKRTGFNFRRGRSFLKRQNTGSSGSSSQSSGSIPTCADCGKRHRGVCQSASGACYRCGKVGHMMKDCPMGLGNTSHPTASLAGSVSVTKSNFRSNARGNNGNEALRQGRVFALVPGDVQNTESVVSEAILVACDFPNVFPDDLPGDLIGREIEFTIDVTPGTQPISKTPYKISTSELKELKAQLQELLNKKFIRPSTSSWGAPNNVQFDWNDQRESAFQELKTRLVTAPTLTLPNGTDGFQIYSDASYKGLGWKANTLADALSRKSMGSLSCLLTSQRELLCDLERNEIEIVIREQGGILAAISAQPAIIEEIRERQLEDEYMKKIMEELDSKPRPGFVFENNVLKFQNRLCVPDCGDLRKRVMTEAHSRTRSLYRGFGRVCNRLWELN